MTKPSNDDFIAIVILMAICLFIGAGMGSCLADRDWRRESVKQGFAHYNHISGDWEWATNEFQLPPYGLYQTNLTLIKP